MDVTVCSIPGACDCCEELAVSELPGYLGKQRSHYKLNFVDRDIPVAGSAR